MKIPVYTARGQISSTMPGRQIRARKSIQAAQQAEMAAAAPGLALTEEIGEYATTRYKMQVENQLNSAMLDASEALRDRRRELGKVDNYKNVLDDGDNSMWNKETEELKTRLRQKVGKDRYALEQFDSRFRQMEQQHRFVLRDVIDQRTKNDAILNRNRKLQNAEDDIVDNYDLSQVSFILRDVVQDTKKLAEIKAGNISVLNEQQRALLIRATARSFEKNANEAPSGITFVDQVRQAIRDNDETVLKSSQAAYVYGLMKMLDPNEQAKVLKAVGGAQVFLEGATIAEQNAQKQAELYLKDFQSSLDVYEKQLTEGNTLDQSIIDEIGRNLNESVLPRITDQAERQAIAKSYSDLVTFNDFQKSFGQRVTLENIDAVIENFRTQGFAEEGFAGIDKPLEENFIAYMDTYKENMKKALAKDGDAISFAARTKMDGINIQGVDLSPDAFANGATGLNNRLAQGSKIKANNGLNHLPILTNDEMVQLQTAFNSASFEQQRTIINGINQELGPKSLDLYSKLSKDAPMMAHLAGLINENGVNDEASRQIQLGLAAENKVKVSSLTDLGGTLVYNEIVLDAFGTLPEKLEQSLRGVTEQSVEAILTYRVMYEGLDVTKLKEEDLRNIVSFALGGTKDGLRGGIGVFGESDVGDRSYFRPKNVSDEEFTEAVEGITAEKLARIPGNDISDEDLQITNDIIQGFLDSDDRGIAAVGRDSRGYIIYEMYRGEPGSAQAIGSQGGDPLVFTFEDLATIELLERKAVEVQKTGEQEIRDRSIKYMYNQSIFYFDEENNKLYDSRGMKEISLDRLKDIKTGQRLTE